MAEQIARVVPGIPMAALDNIADTNVRDVLRAIIDGWHVRNGATGTGGERFVTASEVGLVRGHSGIGNLGGIQGTPSNGKPSTADIARLIADLQGEIMESPLFKELGERITLIDDPDVGEIAGLQNELNGAADQILQLGDGLTNTVTILDGTINQVNGIKITTDGNVAAIGEINNVSATSTSAAARQIKSVVVQVNDPVTGLPKANANITAINDVSATSTSAAARALFGVQATVTNPATGLAAANAAIIALNNVAADSNSAAARYLFAVSSSVGQKNRIFFQNSSPTSTGDYTLKLNDLWFDTDDKNKAYRFSSNGAWVESGDTRIAEAMALVTTEIETRSNKDNAIASAINTVWAAIGDSSSLIQDGALAAVNPSAATALKWNQVQSTLKDPATGAYISSAAVRTEASTAVSKAGALEAKYTVKLDVNGYVSGFGLAVTANNSTPFSEFYIRADRFAIGSPTVPREIIGVNLDATPKYGPLPVANIPFIVKTSASTVNGQFAPAGVYITNAFIENGTIETAHIGVGNITRALIGDAEINTLKLAGHSVMIGVFDSAGANSVPASSGSVNYTTLIQRTLDLGDGFNSGVIVSAAVSANGPSACTVGFRVLINGVVAGDQRASMLGGFGYLFPVTGFGASVGQLATVTLQAYNPGSGAGSNVAFLIESSSMSIMGGKR